MTTIRRIQESDVSEVATLYRDVYGDDFPFKEFYDTTWIKSGVFNSEIRWYVAEVDGRLLGSAAVMLNAGDMDDLIAEVGRLVVHPDARGMGLGGKLIAAVDEDVGQLSDFAFAECRTAHTGAQKILTREGYAVVGVEPLAYDLKERESVVFVCKLSENAHKLRRNNPLIISEAHAIADMALRNCNVEPDLAVDLHAEPYPVARDGMNLKELDDAMRYRLLRLSRANLHQAEIFGAVRLEYGYLKVRAHDARYLVLCRGKTILGGIGYVWDPIDSKIRIFELTAVDDLSRGTLLAWGLAQMELDHDPAYIGVDVSAHAPRMQRTLSLLGFAPVAYAPSMVFVFGERLDVIRMVKLRIPPRLERWKLLGEVKPMAERVRDEILERVRGVEVDEVVRTVAILQGLTDVQIRRLGAEALPISFDTGERVFEENDTSQGLYIILEGEVEILSEGTVLDTLEAGNHFGEMALIEAAPRSASARCSSPCRMLLLRPAAFDRLVRRDQVLGMTIYRNLSLELSRRLRKTADRVV